MVGAYIFPKNILSAGGSEPNAFLAVFNDPTFSPTSGTQGSIAGTYVAGPMNGTSTAVEQFMLSTMQIDIIPTAPLLTS